jgi:hypothetical protein
MQGFVPDTIRNHVLGMMPGTTSAFSKSIRRQASDAG